MTAATRVLAAKVELQRRSRNPVFFLAGGVGYAHAGNRDEQDNPWVNDDFNYTRIGAEIGMKWDANLYRKGIDVSEALAEQRALLEQLEVLRSKVGVEVRRALRETQRTRALLDSARSLAQGRQEPAAPGPRQLGDRRRGGLRGDRRLREILSAPGRGAAAGVRSQRRAGAAGFRARRRQPLSRVGARWQSVSLAGC